MTWLVEPPRGAERRTPGERLGDLWAESGVLRMPGAHSPLAALIARKHGFKALYLSGAALAASLGLPDLGIVTLDELARATRIICRASGLPLLVDADTGFGETLNVVRAIREIEEAGGAAVQIEDQVMPKKCGHLPGKKLVSTVEMQRKIAAAAGARSTLKIVARTDARAVEGLEAALRRAGAYLEAGADAVFPEALVDEEEFETFAQKIDAPLLANMTEFGKSPLLAAERLEELGFKMVIWPVSSLRTAAGAMSRLYACLADTGTQKELLGEMQTREELYETIRYADHDAAMVSDFGFGPSGPDEDLEDG